MMALLPGIDANDEHKAQSVFHFYVVALSSLPVIEVGLQLMPIPDSTDALIVGIMAKSSPSLYPNKDTGTPLAIRIDMITCRCSWQAECAE